MRSILDSTSPLVMGILNVTPDSFSDGGKFNACDSALRQAEKMLDEGADIIDIGGESTRPGADKVSTQQELDRVIPIIEKLVGCGVMLSIDTSKAKVMAAATQAGASMINDVRALREEGAIQAAADSQADICLMHMQGKPKTMQNRPEYNNLVDEVIDFLEERVRACVDIGINKSRICIDPGFGFGKTLDDNCNLMRNLGDLTICGVPLLVGISRKNMIGQILDLDVGHRLNGSVSAGLIALTKGAKILRVHDVLETVQAVKIYKALG